MSRSRWRELWRRPLMAITRADLQLAARRHRLLSGHQRRSARVITVGSGTSARRRTQPMRAGVK
jgi:hypothetical protein